MVSSEVVKLTVETLDHQGVKLVEINEKADPPEYFVHIDPSRLLTTLEDTLKSAYGILWTLTYGKVNDRNRDLKINLKYQEVGGSK